MSSNLLPPICSVLSLMRHPLTQTPSSQHSQRSLLDMGMKYIHLSIDMQLFAVTKQVCWPVVTFLTPLAKTLRDLVHVSANAVQECGGGNTILRWLHCKADEEFRARSVRGCSIRRTDWYYKDNITIITFTGIFNWKSLVKAMWAFHGVSVALLK